MSGITHAKIPAGANDPSYDVDFDDWKADHLIADGSIPAVKVAGLPTEVTDGTVDVNGVTQIDYVFGTGTGPTLYKKRLLYSDFVDVAGSGVVAGFLVIPSGRVLLQARWLVVVAFDDTAMGSLDVNLNAGVPGYSPFNTVTDNALTAFPSAGFPNSDLIEMDLPGGTRQMILSNGATLDASYPGWSHDGTVGTADLYFLLATATTWVNP